MLARGDFALAFGGNCTIALAVMAALRRLEAGPPGLLYADRHYDLNTPDSTTDGALDWMGLAHALALPGCVDVLTYALGPGRCWSHTRWHGSGCSRSGRRTGNANRQPGSACTWPPARPWPPIRPALPQPRLTASPAGPLAVHIDVDVLDFTDAPLAEDTGGRNTGFTLDL